MSRRPGRDECHEYYHRYIEQVPDGEITAILRRQLDGAVDLLRSVPRDLEEFRYAPGKWTLKEVLGHVVDMEWVFTYRALSFARLQAPPLPGVEQDDLIASANFTSRTLHDILEEFRHLRLANSVLFESFDETILDRTGIASERRFTVRSILYLLAGHERHHMNVLREKYIAGGEA